MPFMINRVKLSKETIKKMHSFWKVLAWVQNLTNPLPSGMAENYFQICTSDKFKDVTRQLINHEREIVQTSNIRKRLYTIEEHIRFKQLS